MTPYFAIFALLALFSFANMFNVRRRQQLLLLIIGSTLLVLFAGLRYDSPDWMAYKAGFEEISQIGYNYADLEESSFFEPLYNLVVYLVTLFTAQPMFLFLTIAAIAVTLNSRFYSQYSEYFLLALLLYFVHTFLMRETMQIRAGVAAGIVLWALPYVERHKPWRFIGVVALAMGFHLASGVFLLVYPVYKWNWSVKVWKWVVSVCLAIGIVLPFGKLLTMLPGGGVFERIMTYSWMVDQGPSGVLTNPTIIKQLFIVFICLKYWDVLAERAPHFRLLVTPLLISVCWLMVWNDFAIVAGRMGTFFSITEVLVYPMLMYLVTPRSRTVMGMLVIFFALSTLSLNLWVENVKPYNLIFTSQ